MHLNFSFCKREKDDVLTRGRVELFDELDQGMMEDILCPVKWDLL